MSERTRAVLEAALALSEAERSELLHELDERTPPDWEEVGEAEYYAELMRRNAEMESGVDPGIPWSELRRQDIGE